MSKVAIAITTYNSPIHIEKLIESCLRQTFQDYELFIADDGSTDNTVEVIKNYAKKMTSLNLFPLVHGERGAARLAAIGAAIKTNPEYLLIIDSDMYLEDDLLEEAFRKLNANTEIDALVIKEIPYSDFKNFYSKVKMFERKLINNSGEIIDSNSIEAARFWRTNSYIATGGIHPDQIAFEEIQPTIKCIEKGGVIKKLMVSGLFHDEKKVTLINILEKKKYYFNKMNKTIETEENGFFKALSRWYLFRPVYYRKENLLLYIKHPILTLGVLFMYAALTIIGAYEVLINRK